jgi:hypothetical protein
LIAAATALFASSSAWGQAAPQLLPYIVTTVAGNAPTSPATVLPTYAVGTACPSGNGRVATDTLGDGCLATEVVLSNPRYVTEDAQGNIYFSDSTNARIRRIEMNNQATLGVITTYAGGATSSPASTATCNPLGTTLTDTLGDGNLATAVKLTTPSGLVFDASGNLYFADSGTDTVRKIDAATKIVSLIAGNCTSTYGYATNSTTPAVTINAATQSYLNFPYGLALDGNGALYIADEGNQAVEVVNLTTSTITRNGVTVPAGTIAKVLGYGSLNAKTALNPASATDCPNFTAAATGSRGGCYYPAANAMVAGYVGVANSTNLDNPYDVAVDAAGNLYADNTYPYQTVVVNSAGMVTQYAGISNSKLSGTSSKRGPAQTVAMGSDYGLSIDKGLYPAAPNVYVSDASNGMVWRVDGSTKTSYQVAGATSTSLCALAGDTIGDGCPANNASFSVVSGSGATLSYGTNGLFADNYSNLIVADGNNKLIREISSGTQFGTINGSKPVQTLEVHFDAGDTFSSSVTAATITAGATNFTVGSFSAANCTTNSDTTTDCLLTLQANPTTPGAFTGTLQIVSGAGKTSTFPLSGYYVNFVSPTKTFISFTAGGCSVTSTGSGSPTAITAKVKGQVNGVATGNVQFFVDGTQVGASALNSANLAVFSYTFPVGSHTVYATYAGDPNFATSTSATSTIASTAPSFTMTIASAQQNTVLAGQTALYAMAVNSVAYSGSINFSCSGLPSGAACVFYPGDPALPTNTLGVTPCGGPYTEALSITTTQSQPVVYGIGAFGRGKWAVMGMLPAILMGMLILFRRRRSPLKYSGVLMALALLIAMSSTVGCGKDFGAAAPGTPSGTSTVTITGITGSGVTQIQTVTLTVK